MSEENEFNMYKNIVNNYFRISTFEKAKELCVRDMVQLNQRYITEVICKDEALNRANKLQKQIEEILLAIENGHSDAEGWGCEGGSGLVIEEVNKVLKKYGLKEMEH